MIVVEVVRIVRTVWRLVLKPVLISPPTVVLFPGMGVLLLTQFHAARGEEIQCLLLAPPPPHRTHSALNSLQRSQPFRKTIKIASLAEETKGISEGSTITGEVCGLLLLDSVRHRVISFIDRRLRPPQ